MTIWSEYFSHVPDPRRQSGLTKHLLSDILGLALCAMLCGADNFVEMALFARSRQEFLQSQLGFALPAGVPSHDTFNRVFAVLDASVLEGCLLQWLTQWQQHRQQTPQTPQTPQTHHHLSIDGKVARGSWEHQTNVCALTTVSVFASELRLMLCCGQLDAQGGENLLAPSLLELLDLEGAIVTGDAAYCQKPLARLIHERKGDYLWVLKANHRKLYQSVKGSFERSGGEPSYGQSNGGHGRLEERRVWCQSVGQLQISANVQEQWPGLQTLVRVERTRTIKSGRGAGQTSQSQWFYLSSLPCESALLAETIRSHWKIENQAHWVLDVVFGEDRCRTRKDHAPYNLALLRRVCLNLLRQNQGKNSLQATRKEVTWNHNLFLQILHTPIALL